jgi:hypothetical protein
MLVGHQPRLAVLHLLEQIKQRLRRRQLDPQRQRVDEQPYHALDAGNLRRPAGYSDAEHHVIAARHTAEQNRPGRLHECIERQTMLARLPPQCRRQRLAQRNGDPLRRQRLARSIGRRNTARLFQSRQSRLPRRQRSRAILRRHPCKIIAVWRHSRQHRTIPLVRIEREQLPHQHRQRPSIHQQVMVREHEPMLIRRKPDQRKPHQGCAAKIKALSAILRQQIPQPFRPARFIQQ